MKLKRSISAMRLQRAIHELLSENSVFLSLSGKQQKRVQDGKKWADIFKRIELAIKAQFSPRISEMLLPLVVVARTLRRRRIVADRARRYSRTKEQANMVGAEYHNDTSRVCCGSLHR